MKLVKLKLSQAVRIASITKCLSAGWMESIFLLSLHSSMEHRASIVFPRLSGFRALSSISCHCDPVCHRFCSAEGLVIDSAFSSVGNRPPQHCTRPISIASRKLNSQSISLNRDQCIGCSAASSGLELVSSCLGLYRSSASIWPVAICSYGPFPPLPSPS